MSDTIRIEQAPTATPEVAALVGELDRELALSYAEDQRHGLALEAIFQPHIRFFVARRGTAAVGCGGIALLTGFAEIKRMYVRAECRGEGIADALAARLEAEALRAGLKVLRLETGIHQPAAIRFYGRLGFQPCGVFEPYASMAPDSISTSVFLEKTLG